MLDLKAKLHQNRFPLGLCWGSLQHSPDPLAGFKGPTSNGRGRRRKGEGRGPRIALVWGPRMVNLALAGSPVSKRDLMSQVTHHKSRRRQVSSVSQLHCYWQYVPDEVYWEVNDNKLCFSLMWWLSCLIGWMLYGRDGTTDVTRTIHLGTPTDFEKVTWGVILFMYLYLHYAHVAGCTEQQDMVFPHRNSLTVVQITTLHVLSYHGLVFIYITRFPSNLRHRPPTNACICLRVVTSGHMTKVAVTPFNVL